MALFGPPKIDEMIEKGDIKGLIKALSNKDYMIRKRAADALFDIGDESTTEAFIDMLSDHNDDLRRIAAHALGKFGDQRATDTLIVSLADSDEETRKNSAWALGNVGNEDAIKPLQELLMLKKNEDLLKISAESLGKLKAFKVLIGSLKNEGPRNQIVDVLVDLGEKAVDPLINALKDDNGDIRASVAIALGRIGATRSMEPMKTALQSETLPLAREALENSLQNQNR